jgi:hypothetical protein
VSSTPARNTAAAIRIVEANWTAFVDGETLPSELPNPFDELPPPPQHAPPIEVQTTGIPPWRQCVCVVDASVPVTWAPDGPGSRSGSPPPFSSRLRQGQILDCLSEQVCRNPAWFKWPSREVTLEDIERMERLDDKEVSDGQETPNRLDARDSVAAEGDDPSTATHREGAGAAERKR